LIAAQKKERELERTRRLKVGAAVLSGLLFLMAITAWSALQAKREADRQRQVADSARAMAETEKQKAETALDYIKKGVLIRQAALSGTLAGEEDNKAYEEVQELTSSLTSVTIPFQSTIQDLGYKTAGREIYKFELFPDPAALPKGENEVALITYFANHPTFQNTILTGGPDRQFRVSYQGWGCLRQITALIEYKNPEKPPAVSRFDMCKLLGI